MHRVTFYPSESDPGLKTFLENMLRYPVLARKEEIALLALAKKGNEEAGRKLCNHNLRFIFKVALRYRGAGLPLLDLVNEGSLGLMRAVARFDTTKDLRFISYAVWWIRQGILTALNERSRVVRLSAQHETELRKLRTATLRQLIGGTYTEETAGIKNPRLSAKYLEDNQGAALGPVSLDQPVTEDLDTPQAFLASDTPLQDEDLYAKERVEILKRLVGKLNPVHKRVVNMTFGLDGREPMTLAAIGIEMDLSRERVRQIKEEAMRRMQQRGRKFREQG